MLKNTGFYYVIGGLIVLVGVFFFTIFKNEAHRTPEKWESIYILKEPQRYEALLAEKEELHRISDSFSNPWSKEDKRYLPRMNAVLKALGEYEKTANISD